MKNGIEGPAHAGSDHQDPNELTPEAPNPAPADGADDAAWRAYRIEEAKSACSRGWRLIRMEGKKPRDAGWPDATDTSSEEIQRYAEQGNVGIITGAASGIIVIDDDTEDQNVAEVLGLPPTWTVITGSGKKHYYFAAPGCPIKNSNGALLPKVDVKGDRGAVVAVGSRHPDTGQYYRWQEGAAPWDIPLADLDPSLLDRLAEKARPTSNDPGVSRRGEPTERRKRYALGALTKASDRVARAPQGTRNESLNKEAFKMGTYAGAGLLDEQLVMEELVGAAELAGLASGEAHKTVVSGLRAGKANPDYLERLDDTVEADQTVVADRRDSAQEDHLPLITIQPGHLTQIINDAESALRQRYRGEIYVRANSLVRLTRERRTEIEDNDGAPQGPMRPIELDRYSLNERFNHAARWQRICEQGGGYRDCDCPVRIALYYLARQGSWEFPPLLGIVEAPTLRPDGSVLDQTGYDARTGLYFDARGRKFPAIASEPSQEDAMRALDQLSKLIEGFPFVEECDRSAALAAILTGLVRRSLRTAPLFAFRAPKMGSGKTLLADTTAMVVTGRPVVVMPHGKDEEEEKKRLLSILMEGHAVACIDNIERPFGSAAMCAVLTAPTYRDRVLGKSGTVTVPTTATWIATGNNLQLVGDMTTRAVVCRLDANAEHPEDREFDINLHEYVPEHRAELVVAGLTVLRAYIVAGSPRQAISAWGRFEEWSDLIRSALIWLDQADPCAGRQQIESHDPVRERLRGILEAWYRVFGDGEVSAREVLDKIADLGGGVAQDLAEQVLEVAGVGGKPSGQKLGMWLGKHERRPEGGLRIERMPLRRGIATWRVVRCGE